MSLVVEDEQRKRSSGSSSSLGTESFCDMQNARREKDFFLMVSA